MIYEWRIYEVVPGKMDALNARFANLTLNIFNRLDMQVVGFWKAKQRMLLVRGGLIISYLKDIENK